MAVDAPEHVLEIPNDVLEFWQAATGIEDKDALLAHIRVFQEKAVAIYDCPCFSALCVQMDCSDAKIDPCIRSFRFAKCLPLVILPLSGDRLIASCTQTQAMSASKI